VPILRVRTLLLLPILVAVVLALAVVALNVRLFVFPASSTPAHADAVVVLAGGDGERLDHGLQLMADGVADTLVVSTGPDELCGSDPAYEVVCFLPQPDDTRGEAQAIGRLAEERGWDHLVLVTSDYHATRAGVLVGRCFAGDLDVSPAASHKAPLSLFAAITHEWGGLIETAVRRDC
jgi:uncharacterized SAM-binding protein YcdF (DUF218 family)